MNTQSIRDLDYHSIPDIAHAVRTFFISADNSRSPECLDLDPRSGFIRLSRTPAKEFRKFGIHTISGLMNPRKEFQAVLEGEFGSGILTLKNSHRGIHLDWIGCQARSECA